MKGFILSLTKPSIINTRSFSWLYAMLITLAYSALAGYGAFINYSPVPFWDMWNGQLLFNFRAESGEGWSAWWEQHNEHRLVIPKTIFLLDYYFFNNSLVFLFALNIILSLLNFLALSWIAYKVSHKNNPDSLLPLTIAALASLCFSWLQIENYVWAFQSQFFLSYLMPLTCFIFLAAYKETQKKLYLSLSMALGILSAGTMANGLFASALLIPLAIILKLRTVTILQLFGCALFTWLAYFFLPPFVKSSSASTISTLINQPLQLFEYTFTYLGGPWFFILGEQSLKIALFAGVIFSISCILIIAYGLRTKFSSFQWALLIFIIFIGGTAFATASGRISIGVEQSLSSRYLTPQLLAWSTLIVLALSISNRNKWLGRILIISTLLIPLLLLPTQLKSRHVLPHTFEKLVAALALQINAYDEFYFSRIYFDNVLLRQIADQAIEKKTSVFVFPLLRDANNLLGTQIDTSAMPPCKGYLDVITPLSQGVFSRVEGWVFDTASRTIPQQVLLLDSSGKILGYALTGQSRRDLRKLLPDKVYKKSGFVGYSKHSSEIKSLVGMNPNCRLQL